MQTTLRWWQTQKKTERTPGKQEEMTNCKKKRMPCRLQKRQLSVWIIDWGCRNLASTKNFNHLGCVATDNRRCVKSQAAEKITKDVFQKLSNKTMKNIVRNKENSAEVLCNFLSKFPYVSESWIISSQMKMRFKVTMMMFYRRIPQTKHVSKETRKLRLKIRKSHKRRYIFSRSQFVKKSSTHTIMFILMTTIDRKLYQWDIMKQKSWNNILGFNNEEIPNSKLK